MKKIKQNQHLYTAFYVMIVFSVLALILCLVLSFIHLHWTKNGIQSLATYKNDQVTYFSAEDMDFITVEAPYQSASLEGTKFIIYYNQNNTTSCYIPEQIKLGLIIGICSVVFIIASLSLHLIIKKRTEQSIEIIMNGQSLISDINEIEIVEDSNDVKYVVLHSKYIDPFDQKEYSFTSPKIRDKHLINNPKLSGTVQIHFLKEDPTKYVVTAYQYDEN